MADTMRPMPVGYRFHPTDEEYVGHYLHKKNLGQLNDICCIIPEIDFCNWEPRELPAKFRESSRILSDDPEWWFFCEQGLRAQRSTKEGYWKITGQDRKITARVNKKLIGTKKTLVFHQGKGRKAKKTSWVMHEYHLSATDCSHQSTRKFTLCRIKCKEHDEHDSNTSSDSQKNNHVATYFDDSVPVDDHLIPEDAVQAKMAWLLEPDSSQFMSSCSDPMLDHYAQSTMPCPLESVKVSHHLKSDGLDYQNKAQSEDPKDPLNENPQDQHSGQAKKPCSLEPDSLHSGLHKKSLLDPLPDLVEDVQQTKKQPEDVKGFLNEESITQYSGLAKKPCSPEADFPNSGFHKKSSLDPLPDFVEDVQQTKKQPEDCTSFLNQESVTQHSGQAKKSCSLQPGSSQSGLDEWSFLEPLPDIIKDVNEFLNEERRIQFGQPSLEVSNTNENQALEVDSKKDTGLNSVEGVAETGDDKGIVKDQCDSIPHISCLAADPPPNQPTEFFPIKQENICTSYLPKAGPGLTGPKRSRKIQDNTGMSKEPKSPRMKMQSSPSSAATLQTKVGPWYANDEAG